MEEMLEASQKRGPGRPRRMKPHDTGDGGSTALRGNVRSRLRQAGWTATEDQHVELRDDFMLALEAVDDILERLDLPSPIGAQTTIAGMGPRPIPAVRLPSGSPATAWLFMTRRRTGSSTRHDGRAWTDRTDVGPGAERFYRLTGYDGAWSITFEDAPSAGTSSIVVSYVSKNWLINGTAKSDLTDPADVLPPRKGTVWRAAPYQDKYLEYEALIAGCRMTPRRRVVKATRRSRMP